MKGIPDEIVIEAIARLRRCSIEDARARVPTTVDLERLKRHPQVVAMCAQIKAERILAELEGPPSWIGLDDVPEPAPKNTRRR